ncbi:hypothetical protein [Undibacterium sp. TJN19]|uniref:hypothetical protein n=1 Tax=Undibacterium sp. TJN19 TaxID=3413055 RepID=UPI003BF16123
MTKKYWFGLGPSLLLGAGIVISTLIAVLAEESRWLVLAAPLLLTLAVISADVLESRLRKKSSTPSAAALIFAVAFLLAGVILAFSDPESLKTFMPILGVAAWVTLLLRPNHRDN